MGKGEKRSGRFTLLAGGAVFLTSLVLYLTTLAPTVLSFDSAALQAKAYLLGIGHPTGYPTYIMLGKLFTYLPIGDVAYRVNLASAAYATLAALFVYLAALRLTSGALGVLASGIAALAFATGPMLWSQAVVAEVYTLNALLVAATLYTLLVWRDSRRDRYLLLAAFLGGLSMTAHMTSGLLLPAALLFVFFSERSKLADIGFLAKAAGAFVLGLSPYLYLPVRASMDPPLNYADPSDLEGLRFILSGGNFKGLMFAFGPAELPARIGLYWEHLTQQLALPLLAVVLLGAAVLLWRDRPTAALLGAFLIGSLVYALEYNISDIEPYFIPTYLILALLLAVGLDRLAEALRLPRRSGWLPPATVLLAASLVVLVGAIETRSRVDQSDNYEYRRLIEAVAQNTQRGATVLGHRETATLGYMQLVENRREDLKIVTVTAENAQERARNALREGPTYFAEPSIGFRGTLESAGLSLVPIERGLLYEVRPAEAAQP